MYLFELWLSSFLDICPGVELLSYVLGTSVFRFLRSLHSVLRSSCTDFHSLQQCGRFQNSIFLNGWDTGTQEPLPRPHQGWRSLCGPCPPRGWSSRSTHLWCAHVLGRARGEPPKSLLTGTKPARGRPAHFQTILLMRLFFPAWGQDLPPIFSAPSSPSPRWCPWKHLF